MKVSFNGARKKLVRDFNDLIGEMHDSGALSTAPELDDPVAEALQDIRQDIGLLCLMYSDGDPDMACLNNEADNLKKIFPED